jgi:hypothetical protein
VSNSALLCWYHHQLVDTQDITMHWTGKPTTTSDATPGSAATRNATGGTSGATDDTTTGGTVPGALLETGWAFTDARGHRITLPEPLEAPPEAEAA